MHFAIMLRHLECAVLLIEAGCDVNVRATIGGRSPENFRLGRVSGSTSVGWDVSAETSRLRLRATAWRCLTSWSDESAAASEEPVSEVLPRAKVPAEESEFVVAVCLGLLAAEAPEPPRWDEREGMAASVVRRCVRVAARACVCDAASKVRSEEALRGRTDEGRRAGHLGNDENI